jgi:hypothetical protein
MTRKSRDLSVLKGRLLASARMVDMFEFRKFHHFKDLVLLRIGVSVGLDHFVITGKMLEQAESASLYD